MIHGGGWAQSPIASVKFGCTIPNMYKIVTKKTLNITLYHTHTIYQFAKKNSGAQPL